MKNVLRMLSVVGLAIVALYALGFGIAAVLGLVGGLLAALFWAAVRAGIAAIVSMAWRMATDGK